MYYYFREANKLYVLEPDQIEFTMLYGLIAAQFVVPEDWTQCTFPEIMQIQQDRFFQNKTDAEIFAYLDQTYGGVMPYILLQKEPFKMKIEIIRYHHHNLSNIGALMFYENFIVSDMKEVNGKILASFCQLSSDKFIAKEDFLDPEAMVLIVPKSSNLSNICNIVLCNLHEGYSIEVEAYISNGKHFRMFIGVDLANNTIKGIKTLRGEFDSLQELNVLQNCFEQTKAILKLIESGNFVISPIVAA